MRLSEAREHVGNIYIATGQPGSNLDYAALMMSQLIRDIETAVDNDDCTCDAVTTCLYCEITHILTEAEK